MAGTSNRAEVQAVRTRCLGPAREAGGGPGAARRLAPLATRSSGAPPGPGTRSRHVCRLPAAADGGRAPCQGALALGEVVGSGGGRGCCMVSYGGLWLTVVAQSLTSGASQRGPTAL